MRDDRRVMEPDGTRGPMASGLGFLEGAGGTGALVRALDWDSCPLGPPSGWSATLRCALGIAMPSRAQIALFWGPDYVALYNDAYAPTIGDKHPRALGRPARESWGELWDTLGPLLDGVWRSGETFSAKDHPFLIERHGYLEEVFFDISYSAVHEHDAVAGVICVVNETTGRVQGERRLRSLRATGLLLSGAETVEAACCGALSALAAENPADLPWARLLLAGEGGLVEVASHGTAPALPSMERLRTILAAGTAAELELGSPDGAARALVLPLTAAGGVAGLLVAGLNPHLRLAGEYGGYLGLLAGQISLALTRLRRQEEERRSAQILREGEARFRNMADHAPVMVWVTDEAGRCTFLSRRWYDFTGQTPESGLGLGWLDAVHPDDAPATERTFRLATEAQAAFQVEYRLRAVNGRHHWVIDAAAPRFEDGRFSGFVGSVLDIQDRRMAEEARELLTRELSHRIKNIFQIAGGLAVLTARGEAAAEAFARRLQERLRALSLAHDFIRPELIGAPSPGLLSEAPTVHGLLRLLMAPYREGGQDRVTLEGQDRPLGYAAANALALTLHEQATNAMKYGALSVPGGQVRVTTRVEGDRFVLEWSERGGPAVAMPSRQGFGTALAARNIAGQLKGRLEHDWRAEGLIVRLDLPLDALPH
ncbi:PAS domain S-box protein [Muricoccus radiodurans]|uniref:PAS domain S-box protein n=1 Tax=Muricoccus radiodurans TaxID=2231721 RepID=UPI003CF32BC2